MTPREIAHYRLLNQCIASSTCQTPAEVVTALGAMQAQDYLGALWAIGLRLPEATEASIEQAIAGRTILRTWPMRGTLHFVPASDARWMLELLTPRIIAGSSTRIRELELNDTIFNRARKLFVKVLQGGQSLTRDDLLALLEREGIRTTDQRGYHILWRLAQEGLICFGARKGKQPTFVLLEEWVTTSFKPNRDEALGILAHRYFSSHGPASLTDFAGWTGLKLTDARTALEMVAGKLHKESVNSIDYWMPVNLPALSKVTAATYLLPGFDEFMLGYKDRSAALAPEHAPKITPGSNGVFMATVVRNGQVTGTWKRTLDKKSAALTAQPFATLKQIETREFTASAKRYAQFLGLSLSTVS